MRALKGYPPVPSAIVAWGVAADYDGAVTRACAAWGSGANAHVRDAKTVAGVLLSDGAPRGKDAWWVALDAGSGPIVLAVAALVPLGYALRSGIFSDAGGLWSADLVPVGDDGKPDETRTLCLRCATAIAGIERGACPAPSKMPRGDVGAWAGVAVDRVEAAREALRAHCGAPVGTTLSTAAASWVRYELVQGGRGHAGRIVSRYAAMDHTDRSDEEAVSASRFWAKPARPLVRRRMPGDDPPESAWGWSPETDAFAEPAFFGGRVERVESAIHARGALYDRASAYAASMLYPLPTRFRRWGSGEPPRDGAVIVKARVTVPDDAPLGPLPFRRALDGSVFFPSGTWVGTWTGEELAFAQAVCGVRVEPIRWWLWDSEPWLRPFVERWWRLKAEAASSRDRDVAKRVLNSLYGKLAQSGDYEELSTSLDEYEAAVDARLNPQRFMCRLDGTDALYPVYRIPRSRTAPLRHMAAAAFVTARARVELLAEMLGLLARGSRILAVHTDSIATDGVIRDDRSEPGAWTLDTAFDLAESVSAAASAYMVDGYWRPRVAGLSLTRRDDEPESCYRQRVHAAWESLRAHGSVSVEVLRGIPRGLATGDLRYVVQRREWRLDERAGVDRRRANPDGSTRPWRVREIGP